jgi:hypothetical protein
MIYNYDSYSPFYLVKRMEDRRFEKLAVKHYNPGLPSLCCLDAALAAAVPKFLRL